MYNRLFTSIIGSSVWSESLEACKVWITLLAMQDREGFVFASPTGLARISALPVDTVNACLAKFMAPDPNSGDLIRAPERMGRRIEAVDGGWRLLNASHYNQIASAEARRDQYRASKRKQRAFRKMSTAVPKSPPSEAEAASEADAESSKKKASSLEEVRAFVVANGLVIDSEAFWEWNEDRGWPWNSWKRAAKNWNRRELSKPTKTALHATPNRYSDLSSHRKEPA